MCYAAASATWTRPPSESASRSRYAAIAYIFQFANVFVVTKQVHRFTENGQLQQAVLAFLGLQQEQPGSRS